MILFKPISINQMGPLLLYLAIVIWKNILITRDVE